MTIRKRLSLLMFTALLVAGCDAATWQMPVVPTATSAQGDAVLDVEMISTKYLQLDGATTSQLSSPYFLVVASVSTTRLPITDPEGDGQSEDEDEDEDAGQLILTVNIGSKTNAPADLQPIEIQAESVVLLDYSSGAAYFPTAEVPISPAIIGSTVDVNNVVYGFIGFNVPANFSHGRLVWCPDNPFPCDEPLLADLPYR